MEELSRRAELMVVSKFVALSIESLAPSQVSSIALRKSNPIRREVASRLVHSLRVQLANRYEKQTPIPGKRILNLLEPDMVLWLLGVLQIIFALRVVLRLVRSAGGTRIEAASAPRSERVSIIIVPALNETARIGACLDGLMNQSEAVVE